MIDLNAIAQSFSDFSQLMPVGTPSGQKYVFRANHNGRPCVLKIFKKSGDITSIERIEREIEAVTRLKSSYVPRVWNNGERKIGTEIFQYLVEDFIDGETFRVTLSRLNPQPLKNVMVLAEVLLNACKDFEANEIVHRDIKPENILIDTGGKIWVIDFGIARLLNLESLTKTQNQFGLFTWGYGAPEQMRNIKPEISSKADLFSIGIVIYESIRGINPYRHGKSNELDIYNHMMKQDLDPLKIPGDSNSEMSEFIASITSRFPSRRPKSAADAYDWFVSACGSLSP
jgi:eukaryotic-like serine/threonine-protein kinase